MPKHTIPPPNEQGLQRVHIPGGYSVALPPGFVAQPRRTQLSTVTYPLRHADGTEFIFNVTGERNIRRDSPVPYATASVSQDGKRIIRPMTHPENPEQMATIKVDGMNTSFAELEEDISHPDRTEYYQKLFSGAIPADVKRQLEPEMKARTAFRAALIMKAMDDAQTLEVVMVATADRPIQVSPEWFNIMRTIRHESPPDPTRIPREFLKR